MSQLRGIGSLLVAVIMLVAFGECHENVAAYLPFWYWTSIAIFNLGLSMALVWGVPQITTLYQHHSPSWIYNAPAFAIIAGSFLLCWLFPIPGQMLAFDWWYGLASISVVPIAEEIVFRGGVSTLFRGLTTPGWAGYLTSLVFASSHGVVTWKKLLQFDVGLPLGPFFLGLIAEVLTRKSKSLWPAIMFHAACNSTVMVFSFLSPGWLERLSLLYL